MHLAREHTYRKRGRSFCSQYFPSDSQTPIRPVQLAFMPHRMRCEHTLEKKPPIPRIVPLAAQFSSLSRARPVASATAPVSPAGRPVAKPASVVGSQNPPTRTTTPARSRPNGCKPGGSRIRATGARSSHPKRHPKRRHAWALCSAPLRYKTPAVRYKIPGRRISLPSLGSSRVCGAPRYKTSSRRSCPKPW